MLRKKAILRIPVRILADLLELPSGVDVVRVQSSLDWSDDTLLVSIRGMGWELLEGDVIPMGRVVRRNPDGGVDWGIE